MVVLRDGAELASWPLRWLGAPDLALVDVLARLQLAARREGCTIRLRDICPRLGALLRLTGIGPALGAGAWEDGDRDDEPDGAA